MPGVAIPVSQGGGLNIPNGQGDVDRVQQGRDELAIVVRYDRVLAHHSST